MADDGSAEFYDEEEEVLATGSVAATADARDHLAAMLGDNERHVESLLAEATRKREAAEANQPRPSQQSLARSLPVAASMMSSVGGTATKKKVPRVRTTSDMDDGSPKRKRPKAPLGPAFCPKCGKEFARKNHMERHLHEQHAKRPGHDGYFCPICDGQFILLADFRNHRAAAHKEFKRKNRHKLQADYRFDPVTGEPLDGMSAEQYEAEVAAPRKKRARKNSAQTPKVPRAKKAKPSTSASDLLQAALAEENQPITASIMAGTTASAMPVPKPPKKEANKSHIRVHHGKPKRVHRCLTLHSDQSFASARLLETHRLSAHPTTHYCTRLGCCHAFASQALLDAHLVVCAKAANESLAELASTALIGESSVQRVGAQVLRLPTGTLSALTQKTTVQSAPTGSQQSVGAPTASLGVTASSLGALGIPTDDPLAGIPAIAAVGGIAGLPALKE